MTSFNKKGAMFGLDARIALAIFGALSVISGAALYSALRHNESLKLFNTLNEMGKAMEAYILDTGSYIGRFPGRSYELDAREILNSTKPGWKGPYLQEKLGTFGSVCSNCVFDGSHIPHIATYPSLGYTTYKEDAAASGGLTQCSVGPDCQIWAWFNYADKAHAEKWDEYIDGSVDYKKGKFRIKVSSNSSYFYVYYQTGIFLEQVK